MKLEEIQEIQEERTELLEKVWNSAHIPEYANDAKYVIEHIISGSIRIAYEAGEISDDSVRAQDQSYHAGVRAGLERAKELVTKHDPRGPESSKAYWGNMLRSDLDDELKKL